LLAKLCYKEVKVRRPNSGKYDGEDKFPEPKRIE
jgi:hypothetical protein